MTTDISHQKQLQRSWIFWVALGLLALGLALRLSHAREMPADLAFELEAAYRIQLGQSPFVDFYFDQMMPVVVWRMLTLAVAPLVAVLSFSPTGPADCFFNIQVLGLASVLTTSVLSCFSFLLCWTIMDRFGQAVFSADIKWLILLSMALANLAMGFEYGQQQHLFVLLFLPYVLTRWLVLEGASVSLRFKALSALLAALGASFSFLFLLVVISFEMVEMIARRNKKTLLEITLGIFVLVSVVLWLNVLLLPKAASLAFFGWILPLKLNALTHDSYSFYGSFVTPERRPLFYTAVLALTFAFGGLLRFHFLRPLASLTVLGLVIWMTLVLGLSADAVIFTYFTTMLLTMEGYFAFRWLTSKYPRLFWRKKQIAFVSLVLGSCLAATAYLIAGEIYQRHLITTAPLRLGPADGRPMLDLETVIKENSAARDKILIINGKLRPAFPLLALCGRGSCGYFMGTDALGTLSNIRIRHYFEPDWGTSEKQTKQVEKELYEKLAWNIERDRPEMICLEGGEMEEALKLFKVHQIIVDRYDKLGEAQYFTDRLGPREISEVNYTYWVYKIKH